MKILIDHHQPFMLAHGGLQIQIEQTVRGLRDIGHQVEFLRWWDSTQRGDVLHFFGRPPAGMVTLAKGKGIPMVVSDLLTSQGSRGRLRNSCQAAARRLIQFLLPVSIWRNAGWRVYSEVDAVLALTAWEAGLMRQLYGTPSEKVHVVPNGVERIFLESHESSERVKPYLICTATIAERKRVVDLAEAAARADVQLKICGAPYARTDGYYKRFMKVVSESRGRVQYLGEIADRFRLREIYQGARGFVLLSTMESQSLSALEAAASGIPLMLSDLPWARETFGGNAKFCSPYISGDALAGCLREFLEFPPPLPSRPMSWTVIAQQIEAVYRSILP